MEVLNLFSGLGIEKVPPELGYSRRERAGAAMTVVGSVFTIRNQ
ncbi:MAG: hypothetical protein PHV51_09100 [Methanosarcinaceae archaeon]|nr:hypothetical protein [Methanosarcinaceae archaeon]MDD4498287.1 hypothetical protein [Methanosarcinaceae archaeon]